MSGWRMESFGGMMSYRTIHWIKLEKRLLNDHRFYTLSEPAQLIYVKMLMLAAETGNKMPKNTTLLKSCFRSSLTPQEIENCIKEIIKNYPKFIYINEFYKFKEWSTRTNFVYSKGSPGELLGKAKGTVDKKRIEEDKKKNRDTLQYFSKKHEETTGVPYPITYGKDQKLLYDLMDIYDLKTLTALIDEFFAGAKDPKEWWFDKTLSIGMFKTLIPQIINRIRRK